MYHKWDVKNDFAFLLQFFSIISDNLGGVYWYAKKYSFICHSVRKPVKQKLWTSTDFSFYQKIAMQLERRKSDKGEHRQELHPKANL